MIDSPLIPELQESLREVLTARFGMLLSDLVYGIIATNDEEEVRTLLRLALVCPCLDAFCARLRS
jgi:hypothetical protein